MQKINGNRILERRRVGDHMTFSTSEGRFRMDGDVAIRVNDDGTDIAPPLKPMGPMDGWLGPGGICYECGRGGSDDPPPNDESGERGL